MSRNYKRLCTRFYDADKPEPPAEELQYYQKALSRINGPIIEPMCGSGRFLAPLLGLGLDMHGFDYSTDMVRACRRRIGEPDRVQEASFETYSSKQTFRACIIPAGSLSLIADSERTRAALQMLRHLLDDHSVCHIEVCTRSDDTEHGDSVSSRSVRVDSGELLTVISISRWDPDQGVEHIKCHYVETTEAGLVDSETEDYEIRRYAEGEFSRLAEASGFSVVDEARNVFGDSRSLFVLRPNNAREG